MATSRDNVNDQAVVTLRAYDTQGETVDMIDYAGRYEPSLMFLEFIMHVRKTYPSAVRFTAEVVYVLTMLIFLSSTLQTRVEAHSDASSGYRVDSEIPLGDRLWDVAHFRIVVHMRSGETDPAVFTTRQEPVRYLITWPDLTIEHLWWGR